jgi:hypothetical protein
MTARMLPPLLLALALACGGESGAQRQDQKAALTPSKTHACKILLAEALPDQKYTGNADTEEAALAAACEQVPEPARADCKNPEKFEKTVTQMTVNDKASFGVALLARARTFEAEEESTESVEAACRAALAAACQSAGVEGDCVAAGKMRKTGEITESR